MFVIKWTLGTDDISYWQGKERELIPCLEQTTERKTTIIEMHLWQRERGKSRHLPVCVFFPDDNRIRSIGILTDDQQLSRPVEEKKRRSASPLDLPHYSVRRRKQSSAPIEVACKRIACRRRTCSACSTMGLFNKHYMANSKQTTNNNTSNENARNVSDCLKCIYFDSSLC